MASNETEDERLARELQEQFNAEEEEAQKEAVNAKGALTSQEILQVEIVYSQIRYSYQSDTELAQRLMEEEEKEISKSAFASKEPESKELSLQELQKKQQVVLLSKFICFRKRWTS